jgi:hypothetical protein
VQEAVYFWELDIFSLWRILYRYQMAMESTEDEDAKAIIDSLKRDVQEELTLHSSVMQVPSFCFHPLDPAHDSHHIPIFSFSNSEATHFIFIFFWVLILHSCCVSDVFFCSP